MTANEKAASQNGRIQITKINVITQSMCKKAKPELVGMNLMENNLQGISAQSGLNTLHDLSPSNSFSGLGCHHDICILNELFRHQHSGDEAVKMKRYWLTDSCQARKAAKLVNLKRKQHSATPLSREQMARYLSASPLSKTLESGCQSVK